MKIPFTKLEIRSLAAAKKVNSLQNQQRFYKAANPSNLTGGNNFAGLPVPVDYIVRTQQRQLRARARSAFENSEFIRRYANIMTTNVVGHSGFRLVPQIMTPSGALDSFVNNCLTHDWEKWSRAEYCTLAGGIDFKELCRIAVRSLVVDGECFFRIHTGPGLNDFGFTLQPIDAELCNIYYTGKTIDGGIEYDQNNRPVNYFFNTAPSSLAASYSYSTGVMQSVPASQVIHLFQPERIGQRRGLPWISTALETVSMESAYAEAALVAARVAACQMGVVTSPAGNGYQGDSTDSTGQIYSEVSAGTIMLLSSGQDFKQFDPKHPSTTFEAFEKAILRRMASALGCSYNMLASDSESTSYSTARIFVDDDRQNFKAVQDLVISKFVRPVFNAWLASQLLQGNLEIPVKAGMYVLKFSDLAKYKHVKFQPRVWLALDEQKTMVANVASLSQGLKSRSELIVESGREPSEVWTTVQSENELIKSLGLTFLDKDAQVMERLTIAE